MSRDPGKAEIRKFWRELHARQPGFRIAVTEDVRVTMMHRGEWSETSSGWRVLGRAIRLMWVSDAFFAHVLYRLRMRLLARRVPLIPILLHKISMMTSQVSIGNPVLLHPGIYIVHGQIVIDGLTEVGSGSVISPWVTLGLVSGNHQGPTLGEGVFVGTGAKVVGPVKVGTGATLGAGAVVTADVPEGATAVGVPAKTAG